MDDIKRRRLEELTLNSHPDLRVGECVPFYFCPRSVMLHPIHRANHPKLSYRGGQDLIVRLECDLHAAVAWAEENNRRWAFTLSNAGAYYFEDRCDLARLDEIDWVAVQTKDWQSRKGSKQAEFSMEERFPWERVERVGVVSKKTYDRAAQAVTRRTSPSNSFLGHWRMRPPS